MTSWADQFNTYQDACDFYGCDGPRELAIEDRYEAERAAEEAANFIGPVVPPEVGCVSLSGKIYPSFDALLEAEYGF